MEVLLNKPFTYLLTHSLTHWLTDSLTHWLTDSLTHWLTDSLTHWLTDSLTHWLTDSLTHWLTDSLTHWLTDSLTHWLTHPPTHLPTHPLTHPPTHPQGFKNAHPFDIFCRFERVLLSYNVTFPPFVVQVPLDWFLFFRFKRVISSLALKERGIHVCLACLLWLHHQRKCNHLQTGKSYKLTTLLIY